LPWGKCRLLFSNIEEILRVNKYILEELEIASNQSHEAIAQVFETTVPFLQQYLLYYTNYHQASELLKHLMDVSRDFRLFLRACEYQPRCKGEKLPSLLIQPVQRLPRYRLLLETLLKHTPSNSKEHALLERAIEKIGHVLNKLNGEIAKKHEREQMQVLASRFENEVHMIAPHRQLIKEGPLLKISLTWGARQERYVVLMNDMMIYGKKQFTADKFSSSHELGLLQAVVLASDEEDETFFILLTPQKSIYFIAPSVEEKNSWVEHFRQAFQSINRAEQGRFQDLIIEPDGQASLSTASPLERRWVRRKIPLTFVSEDGGVSRREYIVPDHIMNSVRGIFPFSDVLPLQKPFGRSPAMSIRNSVMGRKTSIVQSLQAAAATSERKITARSIATRRSTVPGPSTSPPLERTLEAEMDAETPAKQQDESLADVSFISPTKSSVHSSPVSSIAPTPDMMTPTKPPRGGDSEAGSPARFTRPLSELHSPARTLRSNSDAATPSRSNRALSDAPTPTRINPATLTPLAATPMNPLYQHPTPTGATATPASLINGATNDSTNSGPSFVSATLNFLGGLFFTPATVRPHPPELDTGDFSSPPDSVSASHGTTGDHNGCSDVDL
jgi:hypothetical protein